MGKHPKKILNGSLLGIMEKEPNVTGVMWAKVSKVNMMHVYKLKVQNGECRMRASDHSSFISKSLRSGNAIFLLYLG